MPERQNGKAAIPAPVSDEILRQMHRLHSIMALLLTGLFVSVARPIPAWTDHNQWERHE
jgi:hypothetical protein